mgnify:CR=1 FL=1
MKKILTILTMIASLTFTSCEIPNRGSARATNLDTYFQSAEEAEAFITGCYQPLLLADGGISTQYGCFPRCVVMTVGWAIPAKVKVTIFLWPTIKVPDKAMVPSPTFGSIDTKAFYVAISQWNAFHKLISQMKK